MLTLFVEKKSSEDRDQRLLSITLPKKGIAMGFVQQFRLNSCLIISIKSKYVFYYYFYFLLMW